MDSAANVLAKYYQQLEDQLQQLKSTIIERLSPLSAQSQFKVQKMMSQLINQQSTFKGKLQALRLFVSEITRKKPQNNAAEIKQQNKKRVIRSPISQKNLLNSASLENMLLKDKQDIDNVFQTHQNITKYRNQQKNCLCPSNSKSINMEDGRNGKDILIANRHRQYKSQANYLKDSFTPQNQEHLIMQNQGKYNHNSNLNDPKRFNYFANQNDHHGSQLDIYHEFHEEDIMQPNYKELTSHTCQGQSNQRDKKISFDISPSRFLRISNQTIQSHGKIKHCTSQNALRPQFSSGSLLTKTEDGMFSFRDSSISPTTHNKISKLNDFNNVEFDLKPCEFTLTSNRIQRRIELSWVIVDKIQYSASCDNTLHLQNKLKAEQHNRRQLKQTILEACNLQYNWKV